MAKSRGYPDRRGMGAQSDFLSQTFTPSDEHQRAHIARARVLIQSGNSLEAVAEMLSVPLDWLTSQLQTESSSVSDTLSSRPNT